MTTTSDDEIAMTVTSQVHAQSHRCVTSSAGARIVNTEVKTCGSEAVTSDEVRDAVKVTEGDVNQPKDTAGAGAGGKVFPGMRRRILGFHILGSRVLASPTGFPDRSRNKALVTLTLTLLVCI